MAITGRIDPAGEAGPHAQTRESGSGSGGGLSASGAAVAVNSSGTASSGEAKQSSLSFRGNPVPSAHHVQRHAAPYVPQCNSDRGTSNGVSNGAHSAHSSQGHSHHSHGQVATESAAVCTPAVCASSPGDAKSAGPQAREEGRNKVSMNFAQKQDAALNAQLKVQKHALPHAFSDPATNSSSIYMMNPELQGTLDAHIQQHAVDQSSAGAAITSANRVRGTAVNSLAMPSIMASTQETPCEKSAIDTAAVQQSICTETVPAGWLADSGGSSRLRVRTGKEAMSAAAAGSNSCFQTAVHASSSPAQNNSYHNAAAAANATAGDAVDKLPTICDMYAAVLSGSNTQMPRLQQSNARGERAMDSGAAVRDAVQHQTGLHLQNKHPVPGENTQSVEGVEGAQSLSGGNRRLHQSSDTTATAASFDPDAAKSRSVAATRDEPPQHVFIPDSVHNVYAPPDTVADHDQAAERRQPRLSGDAVVNGEDDERFPLGATAALRLCGEDGGASAAVFFSSWTWSLVR